MKLRQEQIIKLPCRPFPGNTYLLARKPYFLEAWAALLGSHELGQEPFKELWEKGNKSRVLSYKCVPEKLTGGKLPFFFNPGKRLAHWVIQRGVWSLGNRGRKWKTKRKKAQVWQERRTFGFRQTWEKGMLFYCKIPYYILQDIMWAG